MKKTLFSLMALLAIAFMTSCDKEETKTLVNQHNFTENQREVLVVLNGNWKESDHSLFFQFKEQFDTNVVVYKNGVEQYQYQGVMSRKLHGTSSTFNYYITEDGNEIRMYPTDSTWATMRYGMEVIDSTHFRIMDFVDYSWMDFYKEESTSKHKQH